MSANLFSSQTDMQSVLWVPMHWWSWCHCSATWELQCSHALLTGVSSQTAFEAPCHFLVSCHRASPQGTLVFVIWVWRLCNHTELEEFQAQTEEKETWMFRSTKSKGNTISWSSRPNRKLTFILLLPDSSATLFISVQEGLYDIQHTANPPTMDGVCFIYSLKQLSKLIKCTCGTSPSLSCFTYHYHNIYDGFMEN